MSYQQEYLRQHAIENVWCQPRQDTQYTLRLARLTSEAGTMRNFTVMGERINVPDLYSRWHVLQIGGVSPRYFNLFPRTLAWVSFQEAGNTNKVHTNFFNTDGVEMPRFNTFYRYTENGALIIAARIDNRIPINFATDALYLKVYTNAYWSLPFNSSEPGAMYEVKGTVFESSSEVNTFMAAYASAVTTYGVDCVAAYVNGVRRPILNASPMAVGDTAEYVVDTSIKKIVRLKLKDLAVFESTLDNKRKYLLHYPGQGDNVVDYLDDNDIYICNTTGHKQMLFYHRNMADSVRQLTHKDYAIAVPYAQRMVDKIGSTWAMRDADNIEIVLVIRHSGNTRPLVYEATMIQELYKLPEALVKDAMTGLNAVVPFWRAAALEQAAYPALMRTSSICDVTGALVENAYGYHAAGMALGDPYVPVQVIAGNQVVKVPFIYAYGATAYEYDAEGVMVAWRHHYVGEDYTPESPDCVLVEFLGGYGGQAMDEVNDARSLGLRADATYRVYLRRQIAAVVQDGFTDITDKPNYYRIENGRFAWISENPTDYPVVVSDRNFFACDYQITTTSGRASIQLQTMQRHGAETSLRTLVIPQGEIEVFVNGKSAVEGLEFFYKDGTVYITAAHLLNRDGEQSQQVHIRMRGFCKPDGTLYSRADVGFVQHGVLSANKRFDLRDGRAVRMVVGGHLFTRDQFEFSEDSQTVSVTDELNGYPYSIKDVYIPLLPASTRSTYDLIEEDASRAKKVTDYLTLKMPEPYRGPVAAQKRPYQVFSTFFARLIMDLRDGRIFLPSKESFTRQEVLDVCKNYEYLLSVDPISTVIDHTWLSILPHISQEPVALPAREYQFLRQAVGLYGQDKIDIRTGVYVMQS